jgi:hypothetical protein
MVLVYAQLGKVREAVNLAEVLLQAGHTMEAAGWDAVVSLAWASGVVPLQRYAVQLMQRGKQYGHYNATVSEQVGQGGVWWVKRQLLNGMHCFICVIHCV